MNNYKIKFTWDNEAGVWIATSDDVPGLVLEDSSFDSLLQETQLAVPTLLALNNSPLENVLLNYVTIRQERLVYSG
jgi:predicted RNase H-like HicB family nuclease